MTLWLPLVVSTMLAATPATEHAAASATPAADHAAASESPSPVTVPPPVRVRTTDKVIARLIEEGQRRSVTFADLVAAVNATDVIVYVQRVDNLPPVVGAQLVLVPVSTPQRYLRVQVRSTLPPTEIIALIGHELRHALEVAAAPAVRTQAQMAALYREIGHTGSGVDVFDTAAARAAGDRVKAELAG